MNNPNIPFRALVAASLLFAAIGGVWAERPQQRRSPLSQIAKSLPAPISRGLTNGSELLSRALRPTQRPVLRMASLRRKTMRIAAQTVAKEAALPLFAWSHDLTKAARVEDNKLYILTKGDNAAKRPVPVVDLKKVSALALNEDGTQLAVGYKDRKVVLWNLTGEKPTPQTLHELKPDEKKDFKKNGFKDNASVTSLAFGVIEGQKRLASCASDSFVTLYDLSEALKLPMVFKVSTPLTSMALCENMLAGATRGADAQAHVINLYNVKDNFGTLITRVPNMTGEVANVGSKIVAWELPQDAADTDPFTVVTSENLGYPGQRLLDLAHKFIKKTGQAVTSVLPNAPTSDPVVKGSDPTPAGSAKTGAKTAMSAPFKVDTLGGSIDCLAFSPNSSYLACASKDKSVRVYEHKQDHWPKAPTDYWFNSHDPAASAVAFDAHGQHMADGGRDSKMRAINLNKKELAWRGKHDSYVLSLAYWPKNTEDNLWLLSGSDDCTVKLWDTKSDEPEFKGRSLPLTGKTPDGKDLPKTQTKAFPTVVWNHDGSMAAGANLDGYIYLWKTDKIGEPKNKSGMDLIGKLPALNFGQQKVIVVAFTDNDMLVSGGIVTPKGGHSVLCWSLNEMDAKPIPLASSLPDVYSLAYTGKSGHLLAAGSLDGSITLWDMNKVAEAGNNARPLVNPFDAHNKKQVRSLAFSPDGSHLASGGGAGDNRILIWNVKELLKLQNATQPENQTTN